MDLNYQEIGRRIARRRKKLGLKQSVVEERAGISYKYLSSIECGYSIPSIEVIMRLAIALDTTPDEFLVGTFSGKGKRGKTWPSCCALWTKSSWRWPGASSTGCRSSRCDSLFPLLTFV